MAVGLVHMPSGRHLAAGGKRRRRYMGRAALYAKTRVERLLKDLDAGSVHISGNLGGDKPTKKKKPQLSLAYIVKFDPGETRDSRGRWTKAAATDALHAHIISLLTDTPVPKSSRLGSRAEATRKAASAAGKSGAKGEAKVALAVGTGQLLARRAMEMGPAERGKWLQRKLQEHGVLLERDHKFPGRTLDYRSSPVSQKGAPYKSVFEQKAKRPPVTDQDRAKRDRDAAEKYDQMAAKHEEFAGMRAKLKQPESAAMYARSAQQLREQAARHHRLAEERVRKMVSLRKDWAEWDAERRARSVKGTALGAYVGGGAALGAALGADRHGHLNLANMRARTRILQGTAAGMTAAGDVGERVGAAYGRYRGSSIHNLTTMNPAHARFFGPAQVGLEHEYLGRNVAEGAVRRLGLGVAEGVRYAVGPVGIGLAGLGVGAYVGNRIARVINNDRMNKRFFSTARRKTLARTGAAMRGGRYPIESPKDVRNAVKDAGRTNAGSAVRAHIASRARSLGDTQDVPWLRKRFAEIMKDNGYSPVPKQPRTGLLTRTVTGGVKGAVGGALGGGIAGAALGTAVGSRITQGMPWELKAPVMAASAATGASVYGRGGTRLGAGAGALGGALFGKSYSPVPRSQKSSNSSSLLSAAGKAAPIADDLIAPALSSAKGLFGAV